MYYFSLLVKCQELPSFFCVAKVIDGLFPFLKMCTQNLDHKEEVKISSITAIPQPLKVIV